MRPQAKRWQARARPEPGARSARLQPSRGPRRGPGACGGGGAGAPSPRKPGNRDFASVQG